MSFQVVIETMAVASGAVYGLMMAVRKGMDIVGAFVVSLAAAFGGGTLRDLFLDRQPLFWIGNAHYPILVFAIVLLAGPILRYTKRIQPLLLVPDALGMALFTLAGTDIALQAQVNPFVAVLLGVITGTFGGVLADVLCNDIPSLFTPSPLYATCSFTGAWVYWILLQCQVKPTWAMPIGIGVIFVFRVLAVRRNWCFSAVRPIRNFKK